MDRITLEDKVIPDHFRADITAALTILGLLCREQDNFRQGNPVLFEAPTDIPGVDMIVAVQLRGKPNARKPQLYLPTRGDIRADNNRVIREIGLERN